MIRNNFLNNNFYITTNLEHTKRIIDTTQNAVAVWIQTSNVYGLRKENIAGSTSFSLIYRMLIPRDINGTEKSTTFFLSSVIVRSHTAKSAL